VKAVMQIFLHYSIQLKSLYLECLLQRLEDMKVAEEEIQTVLSMFQHLSIY
jgi:hypothetical protein